MQYRLRIAGIVARVSIPFLYLWYRYKMHRMGVSEAYIREAFSYLAQLDIGDWMDLPEHKFQFKAWGNEVHVSDDERLYECVIKEGIGRCVYVDEWREETREVRLEYGSTHETHWWEVYRSGRWIRSTKFIEYLKILYGEGQKNVIQEQCTTGSSVRAHETEAARDHNPYLTAAKALLGVQTDANDQGHARPKLQFPDELPGREET